MLISHLSDCQMVEPKWNSAEFNYSPIILYKMEIKRTINFKFASTL